MTESLVSEIQIINNEVPIPDSYDIYTARTAAFFANYAYRTDNINIVTDCHGKQWIRVNSIHANSGFDGDIFYCEETNTLIVAFRGTEFGLDEQGFKDGIKTDLLEFGYNRKPKQYDDALKLAQDAKKMIGTKYSEDTRLIITGHSLGGGLAQLVGSQIEFKDVEVHTFNAIGVAQMVDNLSKQGLTFSYNYSNITNHVITRDFVSTVYDHLGDVEVYKPSIENQLKPSDYLPLNFKNKGLFNKFFPVALNKMFKGHTISNFTDKTSSFITDESKFTYQSLVSILRAMKGEILTEEVIAPLLTPIVTILFGGAYACKLLYKKIFKSKAITPQNELFTGAAATLSDTVLEGGVSMVDTPPEVDDICKVFVDNGFEFVAKLIDNDGNFTFYVDNASTIASNTDSIISESKYFEAYYQGEELVYNKEQDATRLYVYDNITNTTKIKELLNTSLALQNAVFNENELTGDSSIIGDIQNNILNGGDGFDRYAFTTGDGQDIIIEEDEAFVSVRGENYYSKRGCVEVNNTVLTGGTYDEATRTYICSTPGVTYVWSGYNGTDLLINYGAGDSIVVQNFRNGDLGIVFDISYEDDPEKIEDQLRREKQTQADLVSMDESYATKTTTLKFVDENGKVWTVTNCEKTGKILNAYGEVLDGATVSENGTYMLTDASVSKITVKHSSVDYSRLVDEMNSILKGEEIEQKDIAIQNNIYIPKSSSEGSPTLDNVYYQYTTKPSGGILSKLFTVVQLAASLITQQWWAAAMVAVDSGIAGDKVANLSFLVDVAKYAFDAKESISALLLHKYPKVEDFSNAVLTGPAANIDAPHPLFKLGINENNFRPYIQQLEKQVALQESLNILNQKDSSGQLLDFILGGGRFVGVMVDEYLSTPSGNSTVHSVNVATGSISGSVELNSRLTEPDVSTPDEDKTFKLDVKDRGCPIVLDMDKDGVETLDIDKTNIYFNTQNTNFSTKVGWISGDDAFLAVDKNNDGKITSQQELFGAEGVSGFDMLKEYDSNNDGVINASDTRFGELKIWQDKNENAITDEGELKSLSDAGIVSINLSAEDINIEQNQNTVTKISSYTKSDGSINEIYDVNLAFNKIYTHYNGDYELSLDVIDMPWLRGYGQVEDLQLKMSNDEAFKNYVKNLAAMDDAKAIYDKMDEFLAKWIGCENIAADSETNSISDRKIAILDKYLNLGISGTITSEKKIFIDSAYASLKDKIYANFIAQTSIGNAFEINYDYKTDAMLYNDNTYDKLVTNLLDQKNFFASYIVAKVLSDSETLDGNKLAYSITEKGYGASLISYLNSGLQILESGEIAVVDPNTPMYVIGSSGNDTIEGTDNADIIYGMDGDDILIGNAGDDYLSGGGGNDTLFGGDGNDTLDGGDGDDDLQGGYGDDVYIYNGQGKDTVLDERWVKIARQEWYQSGWWIFKRWKSRWVYQDQLVDAGNDTVIFGKDVKEKDILISRSGDDLVLSQKGTDNSLTIKKWYATSEQRVENFVFDDGFVINSDQIMNIKTDTSGDDYITADDNPNYIISTSGNDTINAKKGDDAIINYEGNTTYIFNIGDGNDTILDYSGIDKIKFGANISQSDVKYYRHNNDLVIGVKNFEDSITVVNWFQDEANRVEYFEFSDGSVLFEENIINTLSATIATGYDDVIIGNDEDNIIDGLSGNDYIEGRGGDDTIIGGLGKDIMKGGAGDDVYYVDNAADEIIEEGNEGTDSVMSAVSYELPDNVENITLTGTGSINAKGNSLDNIITGNEADNILDGNAGKNTLKGGKGNDTYIINASNANDTIIENADEGTDTVKAGISYTLTENNVENLILTGEDDINGTGNSLNNIITGNAGNNVLIGNAGDDILYGGGGADTLKGGIGNDSYIVDNNETIIQENSGYGTDIVAASVSYTLTDNVENLTLTGEDDINGTGNSLNNIIEGNSGDNIIIGGKGADTLRGGAGGDTYIFNLGDGQDVIEEDDPLSSSVDKIKFGSGINKDNLTFTKQGYDLIITINNTSDKITIKNSNLAFGSRIERFEFSDGSYIDGNSFYILEAESSTEEMFADVSYLKINSKASSVDREYHDDGKTLKMERTYGDDGVIEKETFYDENGRKSEEKTYNDAGLISSDKTYTLLATGLTLEERKQYTYNSSNKISQIESYSGNSFKSRDTYYYRSDGLLDYIHTSSSDAREVYTYNSDGTVASKTSIVWYNKAIPQTNTVEYERAQRNDKVTTYKYNANKQITEEYTSELYSEKIDKKFGNTLVYSYFVWEKYRTSNQILYTYNSNGDITSKKTYVWFDKDIVDTLGRVQKEWGSRLDEEITYTYNSQGQITKELVRKAEQEKRETSSGKVYFEWVTHDAKETNYTYDANGNIKNKSTYVWYDQDSMTMSGLTYTRTKRLSEQIDYTYNSYGQIISEKYKDDYYVYELQQFGNKQHNCHKWGMRDTKEISYTYNDIGRLTKKETYKYSMNNNSWTRSLSEKEEYEYDSSGRLVLNKRYVGSNLRDAIKYEYVFDEDGYLIKQIIYKGVISNNTITSYKKQSEVIVNSYYNNLIGDNGSDILNGSNQNDNLYGNGGADILYGNDGNDLLDGGEGTDLLVGGKGDDTYVLDNLNDKIVEFENEGIDTVKAPFNYTLSNNLENLVLTGADNINGNGNSVDNILEGNSGSNILYGLSGNDTLYGMDKADSLYGGEGNDVLSGGLDNDTLYGEKGSDTLEGGEGNDLLVGGEGNDTYKFSGNFGSDTIKESSSGSGDLRDTIIFEDLNFEDVKFFASGTNLIIRKYEKGVATGNQVLVYDHFNPNNINRIDFLQFKDRNITAGEITLFYLENTSGTDNSEEIYGSVTKDTIYGGPGNDTIFALDDNDAVYGESGNDVINGGSGSDELYGGSGNDTYKFSGSFGSDTIYDASETGEDGGSGDTVKFDDLNISDVKFFASESDLIIKKYQNGVATGDQVLIRNHFAEGNINRIESFQFKDKTISADTLVSSYLEVINGSSEDNYIVGSATNDIIYAGAGNDTVYAKDGNDLLSGGAGNDYLYGGSGNDTYTFSGSFGSDTIYDISETGGDGGSNDTIFFEDLSKDEVAFEKSGLDLYIKKLLNDTSTVDQVLVKDYFKTDSFGKIETIKFKDGTAEPDTPGEEEEDIQYNTITGSVSDDTINGTSKADHIYGYDGNDRIDGKEGNDILEGGAGNDVLTGGSGIDTMIGGVGNDVYYVDSSEDVIIEKENEGNDIIWTESSYTIPDNVETLYMLGSNDLSITGNDINNTIVGNSGNNHIKGNAGNDYIEGGAGNDILEGGGGNDILKGDEGNDTMIGGTGNDNYFVDSINDVIIENANEGTDVITSSVSYTISANVENLNLTGSEDLTVTGNDLLNVITGNTGNNYIKGEGGDDYIDAREGNDTLEGGTGNDVLMGGKGNDYIVGEIGNDVLKGDEGDDTMIGGVGNDNYFVDSAGDIIIENTDEGTDVVTTTIDYVLGENLENMNLSGDGDISGYGNILDNVIVGNSKNNFISGGAGNDYLDGGAGNDTLDGGHGYDMLVGNVGDDKYLFSENSLSDTISDTSGYDEIIFDSTVDKNNVAFYMEADDTLVIDYGAQAGHDVVRVQNQPVNTIESVIVDNGDNQYYISNAIINQIIQDMSAYAAENGISFSSVSDVKSNEELMNLVNSAWTTAA